MLACWVEDPNGDAFKKHLARVPDYLWISEDGMTMQVAYKYNIIQVIIIIDVSLV